MGDDRLLVILNFTGGGAEFVVPDRFSAAGAALLIANYPVDGAEDIGRLTLRPYEARVYRLGRLRQVASPAA